MNRLEYPISAWTAKGLQKKLARWERNGFRPYYMTNHHVRILGFGPKAAKHFAILRPPFVRPDHFLGMSDLSTAKKPAEEGK